MVFRPSLVTPTRQHGYARGAWEAAYPSLWRGLVFAGIPSLGPTGGTLYDISGYQNHGALTNMDPATDWVVGENGYALDFDGGNDYVGHGDVLDFERTDQITIVCWMNPSSLTGQRAIASKMESSGNFRGWMFGPIDDEMRFFLRSVNSPQNKLSLRSDSILTTNSWQHIASTYDGSSNVSGVTLYFNGIVTTPAGPADDSLSTTIINSAPLNIGARNNGNSPFPGKIGFVLIYNRVLPPQEIQLLYIDPHALVRLATPFPVGVEAAVAAVSCGWLGAKYSF